MEQTLFGRLLAFWQAGAPQDGWTEGIGFWQRLRSLTGVAVAEERQALRQTPLRAAENAAVEKRMDSVEKKAFWQRRTEGETMTQGNSLLLRQTADAEGLQEGVAGDKTIENLRQTAKKGKMELPQGEEPVAEAKRQESGLFSAAFWEPDTTQEETEQRSEKFWKTEPTATEEKRKKRLPLGEKPTKKEDDTAAVQERIPMAEKITAEQKEPMAQAIDVDALMRQFAQRLWEVREGASRRRYR